ncbi:hypothetical protein MKY98_26980 [Paenibacillus sp. FSL M8-0228]|uniref:hypothetical protein n=1 Tax=Paenibacillus sp. FSL M8-0228 TaxID=2921620 RepID=UPI0030F634EF
MYDYFLPPGLKNFFDSIFEPPTQFLTMARDYLDRVGLAAGHGINLNNYFGFFSYLPGPFQAVVNSLLAGILILGILQIVKVILRLYFAIKAGIFQWI